MPLPTDQEVVKTSESILQAFKDIFHPPPGIRPAHAKGLLLTGTFTPTPLAAHLSTAPHFHSPSTPLLARLSSSTGIPTLPDTSPNGNPRGLALRFHLPDVNGRRAHTDIITHSVDSFPGATGAEALAFFSAVRDGSIGDYLAKEDNENARRFVQLPKPTPRGLDREMYFGVNAFVLVDGAGRRTNVRYRVLPEKGVEHLTEEEVEGKEAGFLFDGLRDSVKAGPVVFNLVAQVGEEGDVTSDNTIKWPESRKVVELGKVVLNTVVEDGDAQAKKLIFDPIPRVEGVEASDDPLLEVRAGVYWLSGRERRAA